MSVSPKLFDIECEMFTSAMLIAADWKQHYFGAAYSTRLEQACNEAELAILHMRMMIDADAKQ